jgi:hypothetical protein
MAQMKQALLNNGHGTPPPRQVYLHYNTTKKHRVCGLLHA